jgi:hypothetical protein
VGADPSTLHGDGSSANFVNGNGMSMPPRLGYPVAMVHLAGVSCL